MHQCKRLVRESIDIFPMRHGPEASADSAAVVSNNSAGVTCFEQ
jgi:hypothetical protein